MPEPKRFHDYLNVNNILCCVKAQNREEVFQQLLHTLKRHFPALDDAIAAAGIASREKEFPTVIAPGLAVPHARLDGLAEPLVGLAAIPDGVDFQSELGPVKLVVMVLSPLHAPNLHMQLLAALGTAFQTPERISEVARQKTPAELMRALSGTAAGAMPDYLKASDLMNPEVPTVLENDSIRTAISRFASTGACDLVVIDRDGDLRGVLSMEDLLKHSLPEHLLWMENLEPICRFQPFAEMLESSGDTKVADVMHEEFIRVDREIPAIQLAKLFLVNQARQLVITGAGGKLAGVVEFRDFCAKVFWE